MDKNMFCGNSESSARVLAERKNFLDRLSSLETKIGWHLNDVACIPPIAANRSALRQFKPRRAVFNFRNAGEKQIACVVDAMRNNRHFLTALFLVITMGGLGYGYLAQQDVNPLVSKKDLQAPAVANRDTSPGTLVAAAEVRQHGNAGPESIASLSHGADGKKSPIATAQIKAIPDNGTAVLPLSFKSGGQSGRTPKRNSPLERVTRKPAIVNTGSHTLSDSSTRRIRDNAGRKVQRLTNIAQSSKTTRFESRFTNEKCDGAAQALGLCAGRSIAN